MSRLVGDGIKIEYSDRVDGDIRVCLVGRELSADTKTDTNEYPINDFASSDETYENLTPLGVQVEVSGNSYCAFISLGSSSGSMRLFPIIRKDNWQNIEYLPFETTTYRLIYTLAVFYLLTSLTGLIFLGLGAYQIFFIDKRSIALMDVVVATVTLFNLIRCIYFFVMNGGASGAVVDYIFAVLPSFLYLTSFTLVLAYWAVTSTKKLWADVRAFQRRTKIVVIAMNVVFYTLFILFVLLFQFLVQIPETQCGGRVDSDLSDAKRTQRAVSMAYALLLSGISLIIAVGFVFFGRRISSELQRAAKTRNTKTNKKIALMAGVFSGAFLLHCIFILVNAVLRSRSSVFSFLGLLITEIIPSAFTLSLYNRVRTFKSATKNSSNSKESRSKGLASGTEVEMK